jgi:hypothetical protein
MLGTHYVVHNYNVTTYLDLIAHNQEYAWVMAFEFYTIIIIWEDLDSFCI